MKQVSRRKFLGASAKILAGVPMAGVLGTLSGCACKGRPNILVLMVDQMQTPPEGYGDDEGAIPELKEIFGFQKISDDNDYTRFFPGLMRLRKNAVVMRKHYTSSAACVPSRASIMTGLYPCGTGVTQTDGLFKGPDDVPFLDPAGAPTIGDWFRAAGYRTHYFGKWHVSEPDQSEGLEPWGFEDWEKSYPEPHGGPASNLGVYRDVEFTNDLREFFTQKAGEESGTPWLAVGSLVNPHDISAYPINWQTPPGATPGVVDWQNYPPAIGIPPEGALSIQGGINEQNVVELNPDGFPQASGNLPSTYDEILDNKPHCQRDFSLKWGLAMQTLTNASLHETGYTSPMPFQLQGEHALEWSLGYNQFYYYCLYLADLQLRRILQGLDAAGLAENTIVVFLSDHGDLAGSHGGMIQKWHNAYEETVRVPMIISSPLVNEKEDEMREIRQPTTSVDLLPTLIGLAGLWEEGLREKMEETGGQTLAPLAGADLSRQVRDCGCRTITGPDGEERSAVFFMTDDTITALPQNPTPQKETLYGYFVANVDAHIARGFDLARASVRQPNCVRALCGADWKLVRYTDPNGVEADEWELYCHVTDPVEAVNLVDFRTGQLRDDAAVEGMTREELQAKLDSLKAELARQEALAGEATA